MPTRKKQKAHVRFTLNREEVEFAFAPHKTLLEVLREDLQLTGTKHGCELGECGTCTVLLDGVPALACLLLPIEVQVKAALAGNLCRCTGYVKILEAVERAAQRC